MSHPNAALENTEKPKRPPGRPPKAAASNGTEARFSAIEDRLAKQDAKQDAILEAIKGMSAKERPAELGRHQSPMDHIGKESYKLGDSPEVLTADAVEDDGFKDEDIRREVEQGHTVCTLQPPKHGSLNDMCLVAVNGEQIYYEYGKPVKMRNRDLLNLVGTWGSDVNEVPPTYDDKHRYKDRPENLFQLRFQAAERIPLTVKDPSPIIVSQIRKLMRQRPRGATVKRGIASV